MPKPHPIDGSLPSWEKVEGHADWGALLLGNGLSINAWPGFDYASLYEQAKRGDGHGRLHRKDIALFEAFQTENFEIVLANLDTAIRTSTALGRDVRALMARYENIQKALGEAVRSIHVPRSETYDLTLETIKLVMEAQEIVFSTSYDLLVYWAMGFGEDYGCLVDLFWSKKTGGRCVFDPSQTEVRNGFVPVYFLHGGLHLIADGDGGARKVRRTRDETVLEQFGLPIPGDPRARPLLISEGSAADKLRAMQENAYLSYALGQLAACDLPLVVFGSALADHDRHLVDAINEHPQRPVAVSILASSKREARRLQAEIRGQLATEQLYFYAAQTHPLGDPELVCAPS